MTLPTGSVSLKPSVVIHDGGGPGAVLTNSYSFVFTVQSDNEPPALAYLGDKVAVVGQPFTLTLRATDMDQEPLNYAVSGLPAGATLTPGASYGTAVLNWTPAIPLDEGLRPTVAYFSERLRGR